MDPDKLQGFARHTFGLLEGAVTSALVFLGDALGLYRALALGPASSAELAERSGLSERWVREWLYNQAAAELLQTLPEARFALSEEAAAVLADETHPAFGAGMFSQLPALMAVLAPLQESFRTGLGLPYDALGEEGALGVERGFAPWLRHFLVPGVIGAVAGLRERLEAGARIADVGCGAGFALLQLAEAFPSCELHGYDISRHALDRAEAQRRSAGVERVSFHDARQEPLSAAREFDLVLSFDCLHDMTHPDEVAREIRHAIAVDGVWILADIKSLPSFEANCEHNPMAALMYGFSVLTCMSSSLSEPGGMGLGTLGLHEGKARELCTAAGFRRFQRMSVDHPVNAFYEVRP